MVVWDSNSPLSARSARPAPTPASSCGATVHHRSACGIHASARMPAPTNSDPATARHHAGPVIHAPAIAATGSTLTAIAALIGLTLQPAISTSTSRNSTALNAPEMHANAIAATSRLTRPVDRTDRGWAGDGVGGNSAGQV